MISKICFILAIKLIKNANFRFDSEKKVQTFSSFRLQYVFTQQKHTGY